MLQVNNLHFFLSDSVPVFSPSMQHRHYSNRAKHKHYSISGDEQLNKKSTTKFHMGVKYKKKSHFHTCLAQLPRDDKEIVGIYCLEA